MAHRWTRAVSEYTEHPAIWTFAQKGDIDGVIEWLEIRAWHSPDEINSKISVFGDVMDIEDKGGESRSTPLHAAVVNGTMPHSVPKEPIYPHTGSGQFSFPD